MLGVVLGFLSGVIFYPIMRVLFIRLLNKAEKK